ncbi:MAG: hypothetical protein ACRC7O_11810 [Fimbriiglobus sp.]
MVADSVIREMRVRYSGFARHRPAGFEKGRRDVELLTGNAMFLGENEAIAGMFTHWHKSILKAVHVSPQFKVGTFQLWHGDPKSHLSPPARRLLRKHVEHRTTAVSDLPVLARDETGERTAPAPARRS